MMKIILCTLCLLVGAIQLTQARSVEGLPIVDRTVSTRLNKLEEAVSVLNRDVSALKEESPTSEYRAKKKPHRHYRPKPHSHMKSPHQRMSEDMKSGNEMGSSMHLPQGGTQHEKRMVPHTRGMKGDKTGIRSLLQSLMVGGKMSMTVNGVQTTLNKDDPRYKKLMKKMKGMMNGSQHQKSGNVMVSMKFGKGDKTGTHSHLQSLMKGGKMSMTVNGVQTTLNKDDPRYKKLMKNMKGMMNVSQHQKSGNGMVSMKFGNGLHTSEQADKSTIQNVDPDMVKEMFSTMKMKGPDGKLLSKHDPRYQKRKQANMNKFYNRPSSRTG